MRLGSPSSSPGSNAGWGSCDSRSTRTSMPGKLRLDCVRAGGRCAGQRQRGCATGPLWRWIQTGAAATDGASSCARTLIHACVGVPDVVEFATGYSQWVVGGSHRAGSAPHHADRVCDHSWRRSLVEPCHRSGGTGHRFSCVPGPLRAERFVRVGCVVWPRRVRRRPAHVVSASGRRFVRVATPLTRPIAPVRDPRPPVGCDRVLSRSILMCTIIF